MMAEAPARYPSYLYDTRRSLLRHFPYSIIFLEGEKKDPSDCSGPLPQKTGLLEASRALGDGGIDGGRPMKDPIVAEVRKHRMDHTREFNGDLDAIGKDLIKVQKNLGLKVVRLPPRKLKPASNSKRGK